MQKHARLLSNFSGFSYDLAEHEPAWFAAIERLRQFQVVDSEQWINDQLDAGQRVLAEGAQGTLLDIDFRDLSLCDQFHHNGCGRCTGLGVAPTRIGEVIGIFKAYCTRVGSGPFPTELHDETGEACVARAMNSAPQQAAPAAVDGSICLPEARVHAQWRYPAVHDEGRRARLL